VSKRNYQYHISTGKGFKQDLLRKNGKSHSIREGNTKDISLREIPYHIIQNAISKNPFFSFSSLKKYYPQEKKL